MKVEEEVGSHSFFKTQEPRNINRISIIIVKSVAEGRGRARVTKYGESSTTEPAQNKSQILLKLGRMENKHII